MATIGSVLVTVYAKTEGLRKSLRKAENNIKAFSKKAIKTLAGIGAALSAGIAGAVGAGVAVLNRYAERIDKLAKTSSKIGSTVEALQKLQYQAELTGVGADTLNMALQRQVRRVAEAANGTGEAVKALKELGLNAQELNKLSPDQQFYQIAQAMQAIGNHGDKVRLAMKIFDSEGVALVNTMNGNLAQMGEEFDRLGIKITQSQAAMVESYNDSKTKLGAIFSGFGIQLTTQLAEPFTRLIEFINKTIQKMGGMEAAAKNFASFMLKAIKVIITGVGKLVEAFLKLENLMLKAENLSLAPKIAGEAIGSFVTGSGDIGPATQRSFDIDKQIAKNNVKIADNTILNSIDGLIKTLDEGIGKKIEENTFIKPEHHAAFQKAANDATLRASADTKAAEKTKMLADAAAKAATKLAPTAAKAESSIELASSFSPTSGLSSGLSAISVSRSAASNVVGIESAKNAVKNNTQSLGKVNISLQTDTGRVAGEIFGEPSFLSGLKNFSNKQTDKEARMVSS